MKMVLYKTVHHFFPSFHNWLRQINEPRNKNSIIYSFPVLLWIGILLFLLKLGSRRQINFEFNSKQFIENLSLLTKEEIKTIAHDGTLAYLFERLNPLWLYKLRNKMINRLIRMKVLANYRFLGYYLIAVDGTGYLTFNHRHCEHCLEMKKANKTIYYYHPILEAKLVAENGIVFSIETEFIENPAKRIDTQDCELAAFYRLQERLKKNFPQLKICLLLDALYDNKKVLKICQDNNWKYIITFKEGSMPATYEEYICLKKLHQDCVSHYQREGIRQDYQWVKDIDYKSYLANVIECKETKPDKKTNFVWITNFDIDKNNILQIAKGGRLRWKIENEAFNMQKNWGYNLEHPYSKHPVALKNFYLLLQIAHIISQLMEKGSLLIAEIKKAFGSIRNFTRRLLESLRTSVFDLTEIQSVKSSKFQIRLRAP